MTESPENESPAKPKGPVVDRRTVLKTAVAIVANPKRTGELLASAATPSVAIATAASPFKAIVPFAPAVATLFEQSFQEMINIFGTRVVDKENDETFKPYGRALADIIIQKQRGASREALAPLTQRFLESLPELGRKVAANIPDNIRKRRIMHQILDDAGSDREYKPGTPSDHARKLLAAVKEVGDFLDCKAAEILEEGVRNGEILNCTPAGQQQANGSYVGYFHFRSLMRNWGSHYKVSDPSGNAQKQIKEQYKARLQPAVDIANKRLADIGAALTAGKPEEQGKSVLMNLFGDMIIDHDRLYSPSGVLDEKFLKRWFIDPRERYACIASGTMRRHVMEEFAEEYDNQDYARDMGELFNPDGNGGSFEWERILQCQFDTGFNMSFQPPGKKPEGPQKPEEVPEQPPALAVSDSCPDHTRRERPTLADNIHSINKGRSWGTPGDRLR